MIKGIHPSPEISKNLGIRQAKIINFLASRSALFIFDNIDDLPEVKYWIRNLVKRDHASFWLPLAHGEFYPDFVCELNDGRMLVVEYKGEAYATNDDSAKKRHQREVGRNE